MTAGAPPPSLSFQERFAALGRDWRAQLPGKLAEASALMEACRAAPQDAAKLEELHRLLHTLAGSAGTFGLDDVGTRAKAVEHELDRVMELPERDAATYDRAHQLLQDLLAQAAA
jgi:chemotaxis protein histidine kinase CheA